LIAADFPQTANQNTRAAGKEKTPHKISSRFTNAMTEPTAINNATVTSIARFTPSPMGGGDDLLVGNSICLKFN